LATDELYKTLEESAKLATEGDTDDLGDGPSGSGSGTSGSGSVKPLEFGIRFSDESVDDEDEWCDFTEENRMQYTSSRRNIQMSLSSMVLSQFSGGGELKGQDSEQRDTGGDGMDVGQADGLSNTLCPWQKLEMQPQKEPKKDKKTEEQPAKEEPPPEAKNQIYIPPALRQSQGDFNQRLQGENRMRKPHCKKSGKPQAPDLNSPEYFPSLSGPKAIKHTK